MARRNNAIDDDTGSIDLTPMLDVVFIMLIFFIVTATFIKEPGVEVNRPDATTANIKNAKILVAVNADNQIWVNKVQVDEGSVRDQIELLLAENPKSPMIIQADAASSIKVLNQVAQAARQAGIDDVSIATRRD